MDEKFFSFFSPLLLLLLRKFSTKQRPMEKGIAKRIVLFVLLCVYIGRRNILSFFVSFSFFLFFFWNSRWIIEDRSRKGESD